MTITYYDINVRLTSFLPSLGKSLEGIVGDDLPRSSIRSVIPCVGVGISSGVDTGRVLGLSEPTGVERVLVQCQMVTHGELVGGL